MTLVWFVKVLLNFFVALVKDLENLCFCVALLYLFPSCLFQNKSMLTPKLIPSVWVSLLSTLHPCSPKLLTQVAYQIHFLCRRGLSVGFIISPFASKDFLFQDCFKSSEVSLNSHFHSNWSPKYFFLNYTIWTIIHFSVSQNSLVLRKLKCDFWSTLGFNRRKVCQSCRDAHLAQIKHHYARQFAEVIRKLRSSPDIKIWNLYH